MKADVITIGNILHDYNLEEKKTLMKKAFNALPVGGALVAIEMLIDDDRESHLDGLLMSLNMLIETNGGFDFSGKEFKGWVAEIGFDTVHIMELTCPQFAAIAYK